ncbi:MAG: tetratricopeptide repeat protein [Dehalococcoidia bacterium]|nr:tetratricopeptide repeat protein [Dehalococcoidia bacterium]
MMSYYKEEKEAKLYRQLSQKAVDLAMQGSWAEAEAVNRDIIEKFPSDAEAHNRLGRSLTKLGDFVQARETYLKTLSFDPGNTIARKNLDRLALLAQSPAETPDRPIANNQGITLDLFAAEMGKAGVVELRNVAASDVLAKLATGDKVQLKVTERRLFVENEQGAYLGEVETEHAVRLVKLINGGNQYDAAILNVGLDGVKVIVKETYQHPSQVGHLSFQVKDIASLRTYARSVSSKQDVETSESDLDELDEDEEDSGLDGFTMFNEGHEASNGG